MNKAASGDLRALRHLAGLVMSAEERVAEAPTANAALGECDQKVVQGILERFGKGNIGGEENENDTQ